jgi:hypothetical protein
LNAYSKDDGSERDDVAPDEHPKHRREFGRTHEEPHASTPRANDAGNTVEVVLRDQRVDSVARRAKVVQHVIATAPALDAEPVYTEQPPVHGTVAGVANGSALRVRPKALGSSSAKVALASSAVVDEHKGSMGPAKRLGGVHGGSFASVCAFLRCNWPIAFSTSRLVSKCGESFSSTKLPSALK